MKIAIITGASSGLGRAYAKHINKFFPEIDEIWLVARRLDRLEALKNDIRAPRAICVPMDLTRDEDMRALNDKLATEKPDIALLINNAGCGYLGKFDDSNADEMRVCIDLNMRALTLITHMALKYMRAGGRILNTCSIAAFSPTPNMAVYCATKAYVAFFSRALNEELRARQITSAVVYPAPMDTEFMTVGRVKGNSKMFERLPFESVDEVARGALKAAKKRRAEYTPRAFYKLYKVLSRILPNALWIKIAKA